MMNLDKSKILSWFSTVAGTRLDEYVKNEEEKACYWKYMKQKTSA